MVCYDEKTKIKYVYATNYAINGGTDGIGVIGHPRQCNGGRWICG